MVKCTGRGLAVKRPGVLSKVQMLTLVLGVGVFSLLPKSRKIRFSKFPGSGLVMLVRDCLGALFGEQFPSA